MRERVLTIAAALVTVATLAFAVQRQVERAASVTKAQRLFGGPRGVETLLHPEQVVAFRLGRPPGNQGGSVGIKAYPVTVGPVDVPPDAAQALAKLLLDDRSYSWDTMKSCTPEYGVRTTFIQGDEEIEVNFCFECGRALVRRDGQTIRVHDFDPSAQQLTALIRPLFPDDPQIQALP